MDNDEIAAETVSAWLRRLARVEVHGYGWDGIRDDFLVRATELLLEPEPLRAFSTKNQEKLVWKIAHGAGAEMFTGDNRPAKLAFVDACPTFFERFYGDIEEDSQSCAMFWDVVVTYLPDTDTDLRDRVFDALVQQLAIPNRWCQFSALHGMNHLQHPRTRRVVDGFQMAHRESDRELYEYCMFVKRFEAP